ncbi:MAG: PA14 domain-containing protein [Hymenobacter sp.]
MTNDAGTMPLRTPENPGNAVAGLNYDYYEGQGWTSVPNFATLTPAASGVVSTVGLTPRQREANYAFRYAGYVSVPTDGMYTFYTTSDDGSQLFIGSTQVVSNDGQHGAQGGQRPNRAQSRHARADHRLLPGRRRPGADGELRRAGPRQNAAARRGPVPHGPGQHRRPQPGPHQRHR